MSKVLTFIDKLIIESIGKFQPKQPALEVEKSAEEKDLKDLEKKDQDQPTQGSHRPLPRELVQLRSIIKKHDKEYNRIRLINPLSNKLWQEMETLRGKNIPYELVKKMTPTEAKSHIKQNPNNIMFLVSGDGKLVSATSTNKWIVIPDTDEEEGQVPGDQSSLIVYPMKGGSADIWKERGGKKSVWDRARSAYVVDGNMLKKL